LIKIRTTPVTFGGPTSEGSPYWRFKTAIKTQYSGERFLGKGEVALAFTIYLQRSRVGPDRNDLDNFLKPVIDALCEEGYFGEEQIGEISISRSIVDSAADEGLAIEISRR